MKASLIRISSLVTLAFFFIVVATHLIKKFSLSDSIAPYHHVILPFEDFASEQRRLLEGQLKNDPKSFLKKAALASAYLAEAKKTGEEALYRQAESIAKESIAIFPSSNDRARLVLADLAQAQHCFLEARESALRIKESPQSRRGVKIESLSILITAEIALGHLVEANIWSDELNDLDPSVASFSLRALIDESLGRDDEVLHDYQMAYQMEAFGNLPESAKLRDLWGRFYLRRGQYDLARNLFNESLKLMPREPLTHGLIAELLLKEGKASDAEKSFEQAFTFSKQPIFLLGQIRAKMAQGQTKEAEALSLQTERILKNFGPSFQGELIKLYLIRGTSKDLSEALTLSLSETAKRRSTETLSLLAQAFYRLHRLESARNTMHELLRSGVKQSEYFSLAAQIEASLKNLEYAKFYLQMAKKVDSHFDSKTIDLSEKGTNRVASK